MESSIIVVTKMVCRNCKLEVQVCYRCDEPFNPDYPIGCYHNVHNEIVHYCPGCDKLPTGLSPFAMTNEDKTSPCVSFDLNALNPETGKRDGTQYTFGESHVEQALARYAEAAGKLGSISTALQQYISGLKFLADIPSEHPTRNTLFRAWKAFREPEFRALLKGKGQTYLLNLVAVYYRQHINQTEQTDG